MNVVDPSPPMMALDGFAQRVWSNGERSFDDAFVEAIADWLADMSATYNDSRPFEPSAKIYDIGRVLTPKPPCPVDRRRACGVPRIDRCRVDRVGPGTIRLREHGRLHRDTTVRKCRSRAVQSGNQMREYRSGAAVPAISGEPCGYCPAQSRQVAMGLEQ